MHSTEPKTVGRFALALALALLAARLPARGQPGPKSPQVSEKLSPIEVINPETSDKRTALAVVRKPPGKGPFPVVIVVQPGFRKQPVEILKKWLENWTNTSRFLAAGYVVVVATYHGIDEDPQTPKALLDILAVVEHVKKIPEVDGRSVVAWGISGGGSFALELVGETQVCAIAVEEPAAGLISGIFTRETILGKPPSGRPNIEPILGNPERFITGAAKKQTHDKVSKITCPVFYAHGDDVRTNKLNDLILVPELKQLKTKVVIKRYPEAEHGFSGAHEPFFTDCDAFFRKHLKTQPVAIKFDGGAEPDIKPVKKIVRTEDGLNLVCEVRGKGDTALVFLHGWCCDREHWKNQVDVFAADYRVVTYDQAGHGESGKDRKGWSRLGLAADVQTVVKELGLKRVILVGHSMGGPVALMAAKRMPGAVVAVVGVDTLQNAERKKSAEDAKQGLERLAADFTGSIRAGGPGFLHEKTDPELTKWIVTRAAAQDPKMAIGLMQSGYTADLTAMLKEAKVPVRCINSGGGFQRFIPTAVAINKRYADYDAVLMDEVGHYPMLERPAEFNQKLRDVLKEFTARI